MRPTTLGSGAVWSDPNKPIIHFGSPTPPPAPQIVVVER